MLNKRDDELTIAIKEAKARLMDKYFTAFINSKEIFEREEIHVQIKVLNDLTFAVINEIRRN